MKNSNGLISACLLIFILLFSSCGLKNGGEKSPGETPADSETTFESDAGVPAFDVVKHDFGQIELGDEVGARFGFENKGEAPLFIKRVVSGCGCTVAQYSQEPVLPGESGFVEILFNSTGKNGAQFQEVRVFFEGLKSPYLLTIVAQVVKK